MDELLISFDNHVNGSIPIPGQLLESGCKLKHRYITLHQFCKLPQQSWLSDLRHKSFFKPPEFNLRQSLTYCPNNHTIPPVQRSLQLLGHQSPLLFIIQTKISENSHTIKQSILHFNCILSSNKWFPSKPSIVFYSKQHIVDNWNFLISSSDISTNITAALACIMLTKNWYIAPTSTGGVHAPTLAAVCRPEFLQYWA